MSSSAVEQAVESMVEVLCPTCQRKVTKVMAGTLELLVPNFSCKCGASGVLHWSPEGGSAILRKKSLKRHK